MTDTPFTTVSTAERRQYIQDRINSDWGWDNYVKGPTGWSYNDIKAACMRRFGADKVPQNAMTYKRDIELLRDQAAKPDPVVLSEAQKLLAPELFPEWRATFFRVPETGEPFQTPRFQHAIFWVMHAATFKVPLPQWVIEYLDELDPKHPFPKDINDLITGKQKSFLSFLLLMAPRHGKAIDVETEMLTSEGWTTAGFIREGDELVGPDGKWTKVTGVFPQGITDAWRVQFSDGSYLITHDEHQWEVTDRKGRTYVKTTKELRDDSYLVHSDGHRKWRIPLIEPIEGIRRDLPIDPYLFGCWLGDGSTYRAEITSADPEILAAFDARYERGRRTHQNAGHATTVGYLGLQKQLRLLGVLGMKYVPEEYMSASAEQRLALLQGLLDTDGSCSNDQIEFANKSFHLVEAVEHLVRSLGGTCRRYKKVVDGTVYWRVTIMPGGWEPFRLMRKRPENKRAPHRTICSIERVPDRETVCFSVDNKRHLYAAGRDLILTHNTELVIHFILHSFAIDQRKRIMFGNGTQKKSEGFIDNALMSMMEALDPLSEKFVEMYGPFKHDDKPWSKMGFTLAGRDYTNKMFSMQPYGISGNVRSFDSDAIIGDDLTDLQRSRSEATTDNDYSWLTTELMLRREYHTSLLILGSHVAAQTGDLFTRILNNLEKLNVGRQTFIVKTIPAHFYDKCSPVNDPNHEHCVLWPELRDYGFLEAQRASMEDDAMFEAVYNQVPMQPQMLHFPPDVMRSNYLHLKPEGGTTVTPTPSRADEPGVLDYERSWRITPIQCCGKETALGLGFDPAASEQQGSSFTAVAVKSVCTVCGRRYWIDYGQERMSPEGHPDYLESFLREYPAIEVAVIEVNAYQKSLARDPRVDALQGRYRFYVKEFTTDERKHDPSFGIPQYGRHYKSGMISIPYRTLYDQEYAETLVKTFVRWPQKPNDLVMAGWLCDRGLEEIVEGAQFALPDMMPGFEKYHIPWHDEQTYSVNLADVAEME